MYLRFAFLSAVALASLGLTGCATLFSSEHRTEDYTPLFASASAGDVVAVQTAITRDRTALMATEWDHATLLHVAVQQNQLALAQALVSDGADVNALTDDHLTPLHMAAQNGNVTISRLLLKHGVRSMQSMVKGGRRWTVPKNGSIRLPRHFSTHPAGQRRRTSRGAIYST